jgi:hypothetical protein
MKALLHNPPPLLHPLPLLPRHHPKLPIIPQPRRTILTTINRRPLHPLESLIEPTRNEAGRPVACHLGVAGAALGVVLAAALVGVEGFEEGAVGGGGLWVGKGSVSGWPRTGGFMGGDDGWRREGFGGLEVKGRPRRLRRRRLEKQLSPP